MLLLPTPRRHQSSLLLPPGLVALAWLLLLGCVALPKIGLLQNKQTILEVAFPNQSEPVGSLFAFPTPQQIEAFGPWESITVSGNLWAAYFELRMIENVCLSLAEEQTQHQALRVCMGKFTSYNTFVQLLDIANQLGIKRYWIDLRKPPFHFNLVGNLAPDPSKISWGCGTSSRLQPEAGAKRSFSEAVTKWFAARRNDLYSPDWRNTWLLLLLLSFVSGWRVVRQWRQVAAQNIGA